MAETQMHTQHLHRSERLPARRGHDEFVRGIVAAVILGLAVWPVIILGVLLAIR
jgi:hypothetical protein